MVVVEMRGGKGGNGCASSAKMSKDNRRASANGGHGGVGGSVIVQANEKVASLAGVGALVKASSGLHGLGGGCHGAAGQDAVMQVPLGTTVTVLRKTAAVPPRIPELLRQTLPEGEVQRLDKEQMRAQGVAQPQAVRWSWNAHEPLLQGVRCAAADAASLAAEDGGEGEGGAAAAAGGGEDRLLGELLEHGRKLTVARGGRGGRGNTAFRSKPWGAASEMWEKGGAGEEVLVRLELKSLADIGFVGFPNTGKSTLLSALTAARPRIGDYPFTTLHPNHGVILFPHQPRRQLVTADIPGLLPGAHRNRGLGHAFLRHISRVKCLVFVLDISTGRPGSGDGLRPWAQLHSLQHELRLYSQELVSNVPAVVVLNKSDLVLRPAAMASALRRVRDVTPGSQWPGGGEPEILCVSALLGTGLEQLKEVMWNTVHRPADSAPVDANTDQAAPDAEEDDPD